MQKAINSTPYGTESNHENSTNSYIGMKTGGGRQFDMLKKIGCELFPKIPSEAIFRQRGYVGVSY